MKQFVCLSAFVALLVSSAPALAQAPSDTWDVTIAPYLMGAGMSGDMTVRGREAALDVSASDVLSNLQFGAMGFMTARKGNWGFGADLMWAALGTSVRNVNADGNQGAFAFYGLRRLGQVADLTFGLRTNTLKGDLVFKGPPRLEVSQRKVWVDPLVGLILKAPPTHRLQLKLYTEIGGFGAGSDIAWQIFPVLGIKVAEKATLDLGYRWIRTDYATGDGNEKFAWDVLMQGPVMGFALRF